VRGTIGRMKEIADLKEFDRLLKDIDAGFDELVKR
jgi:hypothetical protein